jgi:hypothetical protein
VEKKRKRREKHTSEEVHVDERLKRGRRSTARPTARINFRG